MKKSLFIQINTLLSGISGLLTAVILFLLVCTQSASGSFDFSSDNSSFAAEEFESGSYALNCTFGNLNFHRKRGFSPVWKVTGAVQHNEARHLQEKLQFALERSETEHFNRIGSGDCHAPTGIIFLEIVEEIRKIARHLENINDRAVMFYGKFPNTHKRA